MLGSHHRLSPQVIASARARAQAQRAHVLRATKQRYMISIPGRDPKTEGYGEVEGDENREAAIAQGLGRQIFHLLMVANLVESAQQAAAAAATVELEAAVGDAAAPAPLPPMGGLSMCLVVGEEELAEGLEAGGRLVVVDVLHTSEEVEALGPAGDPTRPDVGTRLDTAEAELLAAAARADPQVAARILARVSVDTLVRWLPLELVVVFARVLAQTRQGVALSEAEAAAESEELAQLARAMTSRERIAWYELVASGERSRLSKNAAATVAALMSRRDSISERERELGTVRWGFIGTGFIAKAMAQQLGRVPGAVREAICSASGNKDAAALAGLAAEYGFARAVTLAELLADGTIDVVYVASANSAHAEHCLAALRACKHVLCEKPLTLSRDEAEDVFDEASRQHRLLVDGTFTASLPAMTVLRDALGSIGELSEVQIHKKIRTSISHANPIINSKELGGGLFDGAGSYSTHIICVLFGPHAILALTADDVDVSSSPSLDGQVDWDTSVRLRVGRARVLLTHRAADDARESVIRGDRGEITFTLPYLHTVTVNGVVHDTGYSSPAPLSALPEGSPGGSCGLHPGLGVEAHAVQQELLASRDARAEDAGLWASYLPLEVMRAMSHLMDLIRHRIPTHKHFRAATAGSQRSGAGCRGTGSPGATATG